MPAHRLDAILDIRTILVDNVVGWPVEFIEDAVPRARDAGQCYTRTRNGNHGRGPSQSKDASQKQSPIHANLHR
jgi:hypothetical protein